jgi:hypothetical protein
VHGEGADVVNAVHVIGVVVREEDRIDTIDSRRDELQSELRWRIDENSRFSIALNERADPGSLVPRIR